MDAAVRSKSDIKDRLGSPLDKAKAHEIDWDVVAPVFEAVRGTEGVCFVYFIAEDEGPLKIGLAKDPIVRLRAMQTGNSRRLKVERLLVGDMAVEKILHEFWEPEAIRTPASRAKADAPPGTEWFNPEVRPRLYPIIATAAEKQLDLLAEHTTGEVNFLWLEQAVRLAHQEHDFVVQARDQVRLLGAGGGYVVNRISRL